MKYRSAPGLIRREAPAEAKPCVLYGAGFVCNLFYVRLVFIQNEDNIPTSDLINIKLIMV